MKRPPKRDPIPRVLRQPNNGIVGYEEKSLEEQMRLFSELIQREGGKAVRKLWPNLDPLAQFYVMEQLGCFAGPDCPQHHHLPGFEQGPALRIEMSRQIRTLKKCIVALQNSTSKLEGWSLQFDGYGRLIHELGLTVEMLEKIKAVSSKYFGGPNDRDVRSVVEAQEYVRRRTSFPGTRHNLSPTAVADIFDLNERGLERPSSEDSVGRIQKALLRFRKGSDYQRYMDAMEELIPDSNVPLPSEEVGQTTPEKEVTAVPSFIS